MMKNLCRVGGVQTKRPTGMVQSGASRRIRGDDTNRPPAAIFPQLGDLSQPSRFPRVPKPGAHRPDHRLRRRAWTQTRSPVKTRAGVAVSKILGSAADIFAPRSWISLEIEIYGSLFSGVNRSP